MCVSKRKPLPTAEEVIALLKEHGTLVGVSQHLDVPNQTLHGHIRRMERDDPSLTERLDAARRNRSGRIRKATMHQWPSRDELIKLVSEAPSMKAAAESLGATGAGLRSHCERLGLDVSKLRQGDRTIIKGNEAVLTASELASAEDLMRERGFSPDDWRVKSAIVNEWGLNTETGEPYKQLKVSLERKPDLEWIFPASEIPARKPPRVRKPSKTRPQLWALVSDHQAPLHSEDAHNAFLRFCERVKPDCGVHLGDLVDFSNISKYGDSGDPRFNATAQDCINTGYRILSEIVNASPKTKWWFMLGNHDERIRNESLLRAERLWGIRPADIPGADRDDDALSIKRLLRLDELGITCIDEPGGYKHNRLRIGEDFEIRHGMFVGGNPAKKTMDSLQASVAVGHTHAKSHVFKALFDREGVSTIVQGAEIGHMAQNNLGYNHGRSDWHPGWATVTLFPDGQTNLEHVVFDEKRGTAVWRGEQF